jgi:hypothetical protein
VTTEAPTPPENETPPVPPADLPDDEGVGNQEEKRPLNFLLGHKELGLKVSGFKPDSSVLKVGGGKIDLGGQFDLGERIPAVFIQQVTGNSDDQSIEGDTGRIKSQKRAQKAQICGTATLSEFLAQKLDGHDELLHTVLDLIGLDGE